ncbi:MAG: Na+/H+ antiporter NhaA [Tepidisphaeraceae bacterium]
MEVDLPVKPSRLEPFLRPVHAFLASETAGGLVLMACAALALVWANVWPHAYDHLWHAKASASIGPWGLTMSVAHWINDGLMVVFFLLVGLEIKREVLLGELASMQKSALPVAAALGGMLVPAGIYALLNLGGPGAHGWGVPMATDIAFAVGVLALVGRRVPTSLKIFLLAIAIVDDLGAVIVIALFYTSQINGTALAVAGGFLALLILLNVLRVHRATPYLILGVGLWLATLASGIHATIAGVLLAFTIPATRSVEELPFIEFARKALDRFARDATETPDKLTHTQAHALHSLERAAASVQPPLARVEHALLTPVNFVIVPLFALANAGVHLSGDLASTAKSSVTLGVFLGLLVGKPIGVLAMSWLAIKLGFGKLPADATWKQMTGIGVLCGIGFTMALFVGGLAFGEAEGLTQAKIGIVGASVLAGIGGALLLLGGKPTRAND